ncbi:TPA_asm: non-structural polyprotein [Strongylocentrotus intermedius associated picornavirus 1]|nr:TPA_asm: non-structural polyprotein [Strongylocentrotus intermedius associated picornavirus 1]
MAQIIFCSHCPLTLSELHRQVSSIERALTFNSNAKQQATPEQIVTLNVMIRWLKNSNAPFDVECLHSGMFHQCCFRLGNSTFYFSRPLSYSDVSYSNTMIQFTKAVVHPDPHLDADLDEFHNRYYQKSERELLIKNFTFEVLKKRSKIDSILEKLDIQTRIPSFWTSQCADDISELATYYLGVYPNALFLDLDTDRDNFEVVSSAAIDRLRFRVNSSNNQIERARLLKLVTILTRLQRAEMALEMVYERNSHIIYVYNIAGHSIEFIELHGSEHLISIPVTTSALLIEEFDDEGYSSELSLNVNHRLDFGTSSIMDSVLKTVQTTVTDANVYSMLIGIASNLLIVWRNLSDPITVGLSLVNILTYFKVSYDLALKVADQLKIHIFKIFGYFKNFHSQAADGYAALKALMLPIVATITTFLSVLVSNRLPDQKTIKDSLDRMASFGRAITGFEKTYSFLGEWISKAFDICYSKICGMPKEALEIEPYIADISNYFNEIQDVVQRANYDNIAIDMELGDKIEALYKRGLKYSEQLSVIKLTQAQMQPFYVHFRELSKLYGKLTTEGARSFSPRTEPAVIHVYGESGVGKSGLVFLLAQDLLAVDGLQHKVVENIYMRQVEQEYWDGYHGQKICVYDDFGQRTDSSSAPNEEFLEIIRTGNIIPMMCHMASIAEKARTPFVSKGLILTSNAADFDIKSMTHPIAYKRRRQLVAEVTVNPKYAKIVTAGGKPTARLDILKVKAANLPSLSEEVYMFHVVDRDTGKGEMVQDKNGTLSKKFITYAEFKQLAVAAYEGQYDQSRKRLECLASRADGFKSQTDDDPLTLSEYAAIKYFLTLHECEFSNIVQEIKLPDSFLKFEKCDFKGKSCAEIMDYILKNYPDEQLVAPKFSERIRKIAYDYWILGKEFVLKNAQIETTKLQSLANRFSLVLRTTLTADTQANRIAKYVGGIVTGITALIGGFLLYKKFNTVTSDPKPEDNKTEALFGDCEFQKHIDADYQEMDYDLAVKIIGSTCVVSCEFCRAFKHKIGNSITLDCMDPESVVEAAYNMYNLGHQFTFSDYDTTFMFPSTGFTRRIDRSEGKKYDANRTNQKKIAYTEGKKYDANRTSNRKVVRTEIRQTQGMQAEAVYDTNQHEIIQKKLLKNMYRVYVPSRNQNSEWKSIVNLFFVDSRSAVVPTHAMARINSVDKILLRNTFQKSGMIVNTSEIDWTPIMASKKSAQLYGQQNLEKDASLAHFPRHVPMHAGIVHLFATSQELSSIKSCRATLVSLKDVHDDIVFSPQVFADVIARDTFAYQHTNPDGSDRTFALRDCWEYVGDSEPGDCGSPLVLSSPSVQRKIVGFHVAGKAGKGASTSITGEDLKRALQPSSKDPNWRAHSVVVAPEVLENVEVKLPQGDFIPIGKLPRSYRGGTKTKLRESPLQGNLRYNDGKTSTAPATLRRIKVGDEVVDPLEKGLRKCGVQPVPIDPKIIDAAAEHFSSKLYEHVDPNHQRVLTHEESISGIENDPYAEPINRRSSPGYPWIDSTKGSLGKTKWLGNDDNYVYDNPELVEALNKREDNARKGIRTPTYWIDTLKDERRPLEKVAVGKTRVFAAGSMDYIILFRKYFLGFNAHVMKEKIDNEIAVGINVYSSEWTKLGRFLKRQGPKVIAGDFSNFDGTLNGQILHKICDMINDWYDDGPENAQIRRVLWEEIVSSHHIFEDNVYSWTHSQPSGNPCTVIINSIYNSVSMRIVWQLIMAHTEYAALSNFSKYVNMISFGDDNVLNINDLVIDDFNQLTIAEGYAQIGMTYTDEGKTGELVKYRKLEDVKFLKRGFRLEDGVILAPLELDVIMEMCQWVKTDVNTVDNTLTNVETAMRELSLHPREVFDECKADLLQACRKHLPRQPETLTYENHRLQDFDAYF